MIITETRVDSSDVGWPCSHASLILEASGEGRLECGGRADQEDYMLGGRVWVEYRKVYELEASNVNPTLLPAFPRSCFIGALAPGAFAPEIRP
jgi:hypothetical protein